MAIPKVQQKTPFDILQKIHGDVLVQTGKAVRTASREGKSSNTQSKVAKAKFTASYEAFNAVLDDLESEILNAKSVALRDRNQIRARRRPPQPEHQPVAPPAPMLVDLESLESPTMFKASPSIGGPPAQAPAAPFQSQSRPGKQDNKPVAPMANMGGFDLTVSPEVTPVPVPSPRTVPKKEPKNSPRPAPVSGAAGKLPPKKETKVYPPIPPNASRPATAAAAQARATTGQNGPAMTMKSTTPIPIPTMPGQIPTPSPALSSVSAPAAPKVSAPTPVPVSVPTPAPAPALVQAPAHAPNAPMPPAPADNMFTDMAFSVAPPSSDGPNMPQPQEIDLTDLDGSGFNMENFNGGGNGSGPADVANMDLGGSDADTESKINGIFDLGGNDMDSMDMDFDLGGPDAGENSNFNDMFFGNGEDNIGTGDFGNYFG